MSLAVRAFLNHPRRDGVSAPTWVDCVAVDHTIRGPAFQTNGDFGLRGPRLVISRVSGEVILAVFFRARIPRVKSISSRQQRLITCLS